MKERDLCHWASRETQSILLIFQQKVQGNSECSWEEDGRPWRRVAGLYCMRSCSDSRTEDENSRAQSGSTAVHNPIRQSECPWSVLTMASITIPGQAMVNLATALDILHMTLRTNSLIST